MSTTMREREYWIPTLRSDIVSEQEVLMSETFGNNWRETTAESALDIYLESFGLKDYRKRIKELDDELERLSTQMRAIREQRSDIVNQIVKATGVRSMYGENIEYVITKIPATKKIQEGILRNSKNGEKYFKLETILENLKRDIMLATSSKSMQDIVAQLLDQIKNLKGE